MLIWKVLDEDKKDIDPEDNLSLLTNLQLQKELLKNFKTRVAVIFSYCNMSLISGNKNQKDEEIYTILIKMNGFQGFAKPMTTKVPNEIPTS